MWQQKVKPVLGILPTLPMSCTAQWPPPGLWSQPLGLDWTLGGKEHYVGGGRKWASVALVGTGRGNWIWWSGIWVQLDKQKQEMEGRGIFTVVEGGTHFFFFFWQPLVSPDRRTQREVIRGERLTFLQGPGRASLLLRENMKERICQAQVEGEVRAGRQPGAGELCSLVRCVKLPLGESDPDYGGVLHGYKMMPAQYIPSCWGAGGQGGGG